MSDVLDAKALREKAKQIAEQQRNERKNRKRHCVICKAEESEKTPLVAHPDGIGPACKDTISCEQTRLANKGK